MYKPSDLHGWTTTYTVTTNDVIKNQERRINKLEREIEELKIQINSLKKEKELLNDTVRHYMHNGVEKQK